MLLAIPISILASQLLKSIHLNIRTQSTPRLFEFAGRSGAAAFAGGATVEEGEGEERAKSRERAGEDADAFFDYGPEADFAGAEHEFSRVAVET